MSDHAPPASSSSAPTAPVLRLTDFGFTYRGAEAPALASVDLTLHPGEALAVLGAQGAGTSTLARAVAGLLAEHGYSTGIRELRDASDGGDGMLGVGMLGDDPEAQLTGLTGSVRDEAALPGRLLGLPLRQCLDRADASLQDLGISRLARRALNTLSGGERQLTALAGLLTLRPGVLVLDQPSQALDAQARRRLARSLRGFRARGGAVLLTGHQHDELTADCDQVLFLDRGRPALDGGPRPAPGPPVRALVPVAQLSRDQLDRHGIWESQRPATAGVRSGHPQEPSAPPRRQPLLRVQDLSVRRDGAPVLEGVELQLHAGEVTALLGANGSGKSTLLGALAGLLPSAAGTSILGPDGTELAGTAPHRRARHLAWVGQDPGEQLSASTVRTELLRAVPLGEGGRRLPRRDRAQARAQRERLVEQVMETAGLGAQAEEHPYDLVPAQRKDCVIASALLLKPAVLLLDEPTLGRDAAGMHRLSTLVREFTRCGGAVLVATHDQRWAGQISDHQLRLSPGPGAESR